MKKIPIIFVSVGVMLILLAAFVAIQQQQFLSVAIKTQGEVVALLPTRSGTYQPIVHFETVDRQRVEISSTSSSNPPAYEVGEKVDVYYQSADPHKAEITGFFSLWGIAAILGGIGLTFTIIGGAMLIMMSDKTKLLNKLKSSGVGVQAKIDQVYLNQSLELNGRNPFQVYAKWSDPLSGQEHTFKSSNLWFDPTEQLTHAYVTVFMERDNPKRYAMDISFLQQPS